MSLLTDGGAPTVDEVANAADVSRRTVYLHFSTFDQLLLDATLGALSAVETGPGTAPAAAGPPKDDAFARVDALVRAVLGQAATTLPLGRQVLRLTLDAPADEDSAPPAPRRGCRRIQWIETAVEPLRPHLDGEQFERLVSALAVLIGFESMVVMRDVRGAGAAAEVRVISWAARTLLDAMCAEAGVPT